MTYRINKSDGSFLTDLSNDRVDVMTTGLALLGSNVSYGEYINENFVKLLENFSSEVQPDRPIIGQIWYSKTDGKVKVYSGSKFEDGSGPIVSPTRPTELLQGDIWIDNKENQLWFYDGTDLVLSGPVYKNSQGVSGFVTETVLATDGTNKTIVKLLVAGKLIGIFSNDPNPFGVVIPIPNFDGLITPGFTKSNLPNLQFNTKFTRANKLLDSKGREKSADSFMVTDADTGTTGTITISNETPLILGSTKKTTVSASKSLFEINANDQTFKVVVNNQGISIQPFTLSSGKLGIMKSTPVTPLDVTGSMNVTNATVGSLMSTTVDLEVQNPNLVLNFGEVGNGVTNYLDGTAGIKVDRGVMIPSYVRWNEGTKRWELTNNGLISETILTGRVVAPVALSGDFNDLTGEIGAGRGKWTQTPTGIYYAGNVGVNTFPTQQAALTVAGEILATNFYETVVDLGEFSDIDLSLGNFFKKTASADVYFRTVNVRNNAVVSFILELTNGGSFKAGWWRGIKWPQGTDPTLTEVGTDILGFYTYDGGFTWNGIVIAYNTLVYPIFYIASNTQVAYEGDTINFSISTDDVVPGQTFNYIISGVSAEDLVNQPLTGQLTFDQNSFATLSIQIAEDVFVESTETLRLTIVNNFREVAIMNTTSFFVSADKQIINEGDSVNFTISYTGVPIGSVVTYTLTGVYWWDVASGQVTGTFITNSSGFNVVTVDVLADARGDGPKNMALNVETASAVVTINDTSRPPPFGSEFPAYIPVAMDGYALSELGPSTTGSYILDNGYVRYSVNGMSQGALGTGSSDVGLMYDPTGTGNYGSDDYIRPGSPWEGYAAEITIGGSINIIGGSDSGGDPSSVGMTTYIWRVSPEHFVLLKGNTSIGYLVTQYITFYGEAIIRICMSYTNTTGSVVNLRFMRGVDPDVDVYAHGTYDTNNQRGWNTISPTDLVYSIGTFSGKPLSLFTNGNGYTHNTAVIGNWPTYDFTTILSGRADSGRADDAICCAWDTGSLAEGATRFVTCYYICGANLEDVVYSIGA